MDSLKHAVRALARAPGLTVLAILTLALGIGLNTAMFSMMNALMLRPLPFPDSDRLFRLERTTSRQQQGPHAAGNAYDLQRDASDVAELAIYCHWGFTLVLPDRPAESIPALRVSPNFFQTLGLEPILGRGFRPEEDQPGHNRVIMLSHRLWLSHFNGDPGVVGRVVRLDGESAEIIGVMPPTLGEANMFGYFGMYRPLGLNGEERADRIHTHYFVMGRYRSDDNEAQADARFTALASRLAADFPQENADTGARAVPLKSTRMGDIGRKITTMLLSLSGFVLLIACANLANLLLARAISRSREFAIRGALGASRLHLIRPIAAECALLAFAGGACAILVNHWTTAWMARRLSDDGPLLNVPLDWRVMAFAITASLVTALVFGLAPAWLVSSIRVNDTLKSGTRGSTGSRSHHRFRQVLIVAQFALALVLLTGAAFFMRGLNRLLDKPAGWDPTPLVSGMVSMPSTVSANPDKMLAFYREAQSRLMQLPGVVGATISLDLPMYGFKGPRGYFVEGQDPPAAGREPLVFTTAGSPEYFDVVGTRLLRGRPFTETDTRTSPPVVIVNETMARALFPDSDALGRRLGRAGEKDPGWAEIVGVVEDVQFLNIGPSPTSFQLYKPLSQETWGYVAFTVKVAEPGAAASFVEPIRRTVAALDADLPIMRLLPVPTMIARNVSDLAMINELLTGFAVLGLFLATLGIYGVMARLVAQRTGEIGIRMALGAQFRDVVSLILGAGFRMVAAGTLLGLAGSAALAHVLVKAMPGMATNNVLALVAATGLLMIAALLACWLPARKASRVDPMVALRSE